MATIASGDVVLLDVHIPDGGGVAVLHALQGTADAPAVLALSVSDAAERGAAGDAYFSPRLAAFVLQEFAAPEPPRAQDPSLEALTAREREVVHHLARGYAYKRTGARLDISAAPSSPTSAPSCASSSSPHATRSPTGRRLAVSSTTWERTRKDLACDGAASSGARAHSGVDDPCAELPAGLVSRMRSIEK